MQNVKRNFRLLLSSQNLSEAQGQFVDVLDSNDDIQEKNTFENLVTFLNQKSESGKPYLGTSSATIRVVGRLIRNLTHDRTTGVFDYQRAKASESDRVRLPSEFIRESLQAKQTLVVDIACVNEDEQQWIFGDVLKAVEELMTGMGNSNGHDKPSKVVIFVDELNKYAPSAARSPLTNELLDITARGGSLGIILFGAEQFASRIHPQVYGNCANKAFGLTDATEAGREPYSAFPKEIKDRLSELERGELVVSFDFFGQPLRIKFPPPACRKQEDADS